MPYKFTPLTYRNIIYYLTYIGKQFVTTHVQMNSKNNSLHDVSPAV